MKFGEGLYARYYS